MKKTISITLVCSAAALTTAALSQPSQTTAYHYALPRRALDVNTDKIAVLVRGFLKRHN